MTVHHKYQVFFYHVLELINFVSWLWFEFHLINHYISIKNNLTASCKSACYQQLVSFTHTVSAVSVCKRKTQNSIFAPSPFITLTHTVQSLAPKHTDTQIHTIAADVLINTSLTPHIAKGVGVGVLQFGICI